MTNATPNTESLNKGSYELKLPSSDVVTPDNLWQLVQDIAATSDKFSQGQLEVKTKLPKNTIKRALSYLKYLGFISESREDETQNAKKIKVQYFSVNKSSELVEKIQYELKAGRKEPALGFWNQLIAKHDMAKVISKEFLGSGSSKTKIDLENFLKSRKELSGHNPSYYQNGVSFIIRILGQAGIISNKGNDIFLQTEEKSAEGEETRFDNNAEKGDIPLKQNGSYKVTIIGPGLNTTMEIQEEFDIDIVEKYLTKIKNKISKAETTETHENTKSST